jgi:LCP family protein required for cell wall assembly
VLRWGLLGLSAAVLLAAAAGALVYLRLDGDIRELPLFGGVGGDAGAERPDAFGRTPVNVLVIGSDSRADAADCRLGGGCGPGRNADVAMVLHLSADRSHGAVLTIPRDTVTDLPACRTPGGGVAAARRGAVNSTLQYGPGCTVAAVHSLTGLPVDHFVMADFAGVVRMSGAVGGVPVCVDRDLYDPYSHLRLRSGRHALEGRAALAFLRSRHAFGDGGDLGRADAQHLFLAALARRMRSAGSFGDPAGLLSLADAATRALTVDPGLGSVSRLSGLAADVRKVPSARLVFTTMPVRPDPLDRARLVPAPAAGPLFAAVASDLPLTVAAPAGTAARAAAGAAPPSPDGSAAGPAEQPRARSADRPAAAAAGPPADEAFDEPGEERGEERGDAGGVPLRPAGEGAAGAAGGAADVARGRTAADPLTCARVARTATVRLRGVAMTPTAAFAASGRVPLSAR